MNHVKTDYAAVLRQANAEHVAEVEQQTALTWEQYKNKQALETWRTRMVSLRDRLLWPIRKP